MQRTDDRMKDRETRIRARIRRLRSYMTESDFSELVDSVERQERKAEAPVAIDPLTRRLSVG